MVPILGVRIMIKLDNLGGFKKGRIWIGEMPNIKGSVIDIVKSSFEVTNQQQWEHKAIAIELLLAPREISNYALIGAKYIPSNNGNLEIKVNISSFDDTILLDNIALSTDEVHMGIPKEYALSIASIAKEKSIELNYPMGSLVFDIGAHGHVGSSKMVFSTVTKVLMGLLSMNVLEKSYEELNEIVSNLLKS